MLGRKGAPGTLAHYGSVSAPWNPVSQQHTAHGLYLFNAPPMLNIPHTLLPLQALLVAQRACAHRALLASLHRASARCILAESTPCVSTYHTLKCSSSAKNSCYPVNRTATNAISCKSWQHLAVPCTLQCTNGAPYNVRMEHPRLIPA